MQRDRLEETAEAISPRFESPSMVDRSMVEPACRYLDFSFSMWQLFQKCYEHVLSAFKPEYYYAYREE